MGADSSEGQEPGTAASKVTVTWPAAARDEETIADYAYVHDDGWTATGMLGYALGSGFYLQTISINAPRGQRITAKLMRDVPLTDIIATANSNGMLTEAVLGLISEALPAGTSEQPKRPGRTPLSDDLLRTVALGYLDETMPGMPRGAVKRLAQKMGVEEKTMSRYVYRARQSGWLGPALQGREGSEPGPRLLADPASSRLTRLPESPEAK